MSSENTEVQTEVIDDAAAQAAAAEAAAAKAAEAGPDLNIPDPAAEAAAAAAADHSKTFAATGDVGLDMSLEFFAQAGIKPDDAALKVALETGDFSRLKDKLELLGDKAKGYERFVTLAGQATSRQVEAAKEAKAATGKAILSVMGDQETWAKVRDFAGQHADPKERAEINAAFAKGGIAAKSMAIYLKQTFDSAQVATEGPKEKEAAPAVSSSASRLPASNGSTLSPRAFAAATEELAKKIGRNRVDGSPEYKALVSRRMAWRPTGR